MVDVSITPCPDYEADTLRSALLTVLEPLGGLDWVTDGMTVAIKTNLVAGHKPDSAVVTHPAVLAALTQLLRERGAKVIIGDSPGGLYTAAYVNRIYRVTGMELAQQAGATLNRNFEQAAARFPTAKVCREFTYTAWLDEADAIIDACKLKTHGMMGMSCAAKNMFGVIPGTMKPEYHFRFSDPADFADMIVDLDEYFAPKTRLYLTDAVVGMEGNGPTMGSPRPIGALAASLSPHKLDLLCADLIGLGKEQVPTLEAAFRRGLIPEDASGLVTAGDPAPLKLSDYHNIAVKSDLQFRGKNGIVGRTAGWFIRIFLRARPKPKKADCTGCGKCASICPARAITITDGTARIDRSACICCFCCQEFCPKGAMKVHRPLIARLLNRL